MLKILSDVLVLKNVVMEKNVENKTFKINLCFKNIDGKYINQSFDYHSYDNAINDFLVLTKMIKTN